MCCVVSGFFSFFGGVHSFLKENVSNGNLRQRKIRCPLTVELSGCNNIHELLKCLSSQENSGIEGEF